jgi:hypothetical protein
MRRSMTTKDNRAYWKFITNIANKVSTWPEKE